MNYFDDDQMSDEKKSDSSFNILSGIRLASSITIGTEPPRNALKHIKDIDEDIYSSIFKHLPGKTKVIKKTN